MYIYIYIYITWPFKGENRSQTRVKVRTCMCVCVYVCMCTHTCIYVFAHSRGEDKSWNSVQVRICMHVYAWMACIYLCLYVCMYIYTHTYMHVYIGLRQRAANKYPDSCVHVSKSRTKKNEHVCTCTYWYMHVLIHARIDACTYWYYFEDIPEVAQTHAKHSDLHSYVYIHIYIHTWGGSDSSSDPSSSAGVPLAKEGDACVPHNPDLAALEWLGVCIYVYVCMHVFLFTAREFGRACMTVCMYVCT
jgi:hypothetical protein